MVSPLFQRATRELRRAAEQEFRASGFGRLVEQARQTRRSVSPERYARIFGRQLDPRRMARDLMGSDFGELTTELRRYARGDSLGRRAVKELLGSLGPAGRLLSALVESPTSKPLDAAQSLLRAFGYEVLPPRQDRAGFSAERGIEAARQFLSDMAPEMLAPEARRPAPERQARARKTVDIPKAGGGYFRKRPDHPMVSGEFVSDFNSSNVHSYAYDADSASLYVRFLGFSDGRRQGPGSLYRYSNVEPEAFDRLLRARSKGSWVWDELRIRGTVSGHRKDYELVGITGDYVPRKAVLDIESGGERFTPRRILTSRGRWLTSKYPDELVHSLQRTPGGLIPAGDLIGRPESPNRGRPEPPNRGR